MKKTLFLLPIAILALAGCSGNGGGTNPEPTPGPTPTPTPSEPEAVVIPTVTDCDLKTAYDAAAALAKGGVTTDAYTFNGTVVAKSGNSWFVQNGYSGMYVYNKALDGLAVGKTVSVTSTLQNYSGCLETKTISAASITGEATPEASIKVCGAGQLAQLRQNIRVSVTLKVTSLSGEWSASNSPFLDGKALNNGNEVEDVKIKLDKWGFAACDESTKTLINALTEGDVVTISGLVTTAYDKTSGSPVSNQLMAGETITAVQG